MAGKNPWDGDDDDEKAGRPYGMSGDGRSKKPRKNGPSSGDAPDLEEFFRRSVDRFKNASRGGGSGGDGFDFQSNMKPIIVGGAFIVIALWLVSGFYRVKSGERGVVMRFGEYSRVADPGLNYHMPYPVEEVKIVDTERNRNITVGGYETSGRIYADQEPERQMLTGDENIVNIQFDVRWKVSDPRDYLFKVSEPEVSVKAAAESAMREVIGQTPIDPILTEARDVIEQKVKERVQLTLDAYKTGVKVLQVAIKEASPPDQVIKDFQDVQAARADQERFEEEANAFANRILPEARGEAEKLRQQAEAYKEKVVAEAQGEAARFRKISAEYAKAPEVTKRRLYFETMEKVMEGKDKIILGDDTSKKILPYLPLKAGNVDTGVSKR